MQYDRKPIKEKRNYYRRKAPAGLTAAFELLRQEPESYNVTVLKNPMPSAFSRTVQYNGNRMDLSGGHRFFSKINDDGLVERTNCQYREALPRMIF
jgi:hypothetical protein